MSRRRDEELIQAAFDRAMSETEFEQFEARLHDEPELRALYYEYCNLHHSLSEEYEGANIAPFRPRALHDEAPNRAGLVPSVLSAAAILVALLTAAWFITVSVKKPGAVAGVVFGPETHAEIVHAKGGASRTELREGSRLTLERGTVALTLPSGTRALVEGPAEVVGMGRNALHLESGRAWFDVPAQAVGFTCTTASLEVVDLGTRFGVLAKPGSPEQVHVQSGKVRVSPLAAPEISRELTTGQGLAWNDGTFEPAPESPSFLTTHPRPFPILVDDFSDPDGTAMDGKSPDLGAGPWRADVGKPVIRDGMLDSSGNWMTLFAPLGFPRLDDLNHVLLLTVRTDDPDARTFHSEGWAGISLYTGDQERLFVGDPGSGGRDQGGWAIHPVGGETVAPSPPLEGKQTVTLRYDYRTGLAELFDGAHATGKPVASEWIAPHLQFDQIRVANADGGDIALRFLAVSILTPQDEAGG